MDNSEILDFQSGERKLPDRKFEVAFAHTTVRPSRVMDARKAQASVAGFSNMFPGHAERMKRLTRRANQRLPLFGD